MLRNGRKWFPQNERKWGPAEPVEIRWWNKRVKEVFKQNNLLESGDKDLNSATLNKVVQQLEGEFDQAWKRYQAIRK